MKCPQCGTRMQSDRSATPILRKKVMLETIHYRCDECDAEFVKGEGRGLQKIDGGTPELGCEDLALCTDESEGSTVRRISWEGAGGAR